MISDLLLLTANFDSFALFSSQTLLLYCIELDLRGDYQQYSNARVDHNIMVPNGGPSKDDKKMTFQSRIVSHVEETRAIF